MNSKYLLGKKSAKKRIRVSMPLPLKEAVRTAAKTRKQSVSQFTQAAILQEVVNYAEKAEITTVATPQTGLPGSLIHKNGKSGARVVQTGRFNWRPAIFQKALSQGRFLITTLTQFHRLAMELEDRWCDYAAFLEIVEESHLRALRGSVPLYWIENQRDGGRQVILVSLRGRVSIPVIRRDSKALADSRTLGREIKSRFGCNRPQEIAWGFILKFIEREAASGGMFSMRPPQGGEMAPSLRLLQIAYMSAHLTSEELTEACDAMEEIMLPGKPCGEPIVAEVAK